MRGVDLDCSSGSHPTSDSRHPVLVVDIHGSYDSLRGLIPLGALFFLLTTGHLLPQYMGGAVLRLEGLPLD